MHDISITFPNLSHEQALEMIAAHATIKAGGRLELMGNGSGTVATVEPSTGSTTATADPDTGDTSNERDTAMIGNREGQLDARGVPLHPQFHNGNVKGDGSWTRRRNHDKAAADAYEAPYLQEKPAAAAHVEAAAPAASAAFTDAPSTAAPSATFEAPAVRYLPSVAEYEGKWAQLCRELKVTGEHQAFIERTFGGHPCNPVVRDVEENRRQIWVVFLQWEQGVKGF